MHRCVRLSFFLALSLALAAPAFALDDIFLRPTAAGSVIMQVEGGERKTLSVGETFFETPRDVHTVSMNASDTDPAKILVFTVKPQGTPVSIPVP